METFFFGSETSGLSDEVFLNFKKRKNFHTNASKQ